MDLPYACFVAREIEMSAYINAPSKLPVNVE